MTTYLPPIHRHAKLVQEVWVREDAFRASKGWFSCDTKCQVCAFM